MVALQSSVSPMILPSGVQVIWWKSLTQSSEMRADFPVARSNIPGGQYHVGEPIGATNFPFRMLPHLSSRHIEDPQMRAGTRLRPEFGSNHQSLTAARNGSQVINV